ncbi:asparagine synthase (glutamine-hydrolyzing) [soil metagenome]
MCGIAGILRKDDRAQALEPLLIDLQKHLRHRGPDDEGLWMDDRRHIGFTHTRLAILDLSPAGHQPMQSPDGRLVITFNGEIYNFRELRSSLEFDGAVFHTQTDTEVLLHLYAKHGAAMLDHLRGMFAFCIWDRLANRAFLARDPLGIKPLYYCQHDDQLTFASELQALIKAGISRKKINAQAVYDYLIDGSVAEPNTLCEDVHCLPAGHHILWEKGRLTVARYWEPQFAWHDSPAPSEESIPYTRKALTDSLQQHFISNVPVGIFLSGGIDSTALLALAKASDIPQVQTYSVGVDDPLMNESDAAARTAKHFDVEHHVMPLSGERALELFGQFLNHQDQPSIDGLNTFSASCLAHEQGLKVVLSGLGGDELFSGYPSFQAIPRMMGLASLLRAFGPLRSVIGRALQNKKIPGRYQRLGSYLAGDTGVSSAFRAFRGVFTPDQARTLTDRLITGSWCPEFHTHESESGDEDIGDQISHLEMTRYMRNQLLRDTDVMSMAWGLELRVPFVDRFLFEQMSHLPPNLRLQKGKKLLLDAIPEIPEWVAQAPKRGFRFPFQRWLETSWGGALTIPEGLLDGGMNAWYQQWAIFVLLQWQDRLGVH